MSPSINRFLSVIRKLAGIGITAAMILCSADVGAQSKKVSLVSSSSTVGQVLKDIEAQTGYLFVYNTSDIDVSKKVSLNFKDAAVSQVLDSVLDGHNVKWHFEGRYIKIMKQEPDGQSKSNGPVKIQGKVCAADGEPLIGASIMVKGTSTGVITDMDGQFTMEIPTPGTVLVASYLGFVDQEFEAVGENFDIFLQEDNNTLDELIVVGYGTQRKVTLPVLWALWAEKHLLTGNPPRLQPLFRVQWPESQSHEAATNRATREATSRSGVSPQSETPLLSS